MSALSKRYGNALFKLAQEENAQDLFMAQAELLISTAQGEDGSLKILTHPLISTEEKSAFVDKVYGNVLHPHFIGFMKLAIAKNREAFILPALYKLVEMIKLAKNQVVAHIVTATPLTEGQQASLTAAFTRKLGKIIELKIDIDPSKIAGISIHVDGYFIDRTAKTMLKGMRDSFMVS